MIDVDDLRSVVGFLTAPEALPRTPVANGAVTREYLVDELAQLGVEPLVDGYVQPIPTIDGGNVLGSIPGASGRTILLCAHHDACDPYGESLPGAGDNAAAVAVVLATARALVARRSDLRRPVAICFFDTEEPPYFLTPDMGSQWFVDHPPLPLDSIDMMVCLDLVGHGLGPPGIPDEVAESTFLLGAELSHRTGALVDRLPAVDGIRVRRIDNHVIPAMSDYHAFNEAGIPFVFYTTGRTEHYHVATDTSDTLDFPKMAAFAEHLTHLVVALSTRPEARVEFDREGSDDRATVASLFDVLEPLRDATPMVGSTLPLLAELGVAADVRPLTANERGLLSTIVLEIENQLA